MDCNQYLNKTVNIAINCINNCYNNIKKLCYDKNDIFTIKKNTEIVLNPPGINEPSGINISDYYVINEEDIKSEEEHLINIKNE